MTDNWTCSHGHDKAEHWVDGYYSCPHFRRSADPTSIDAAARDLVHHIARMHERWADMGAENPEARNRELWAPLHRKADALRDLLPGDESS